MAVVGNPKPGSNSDTQAGAQVISISLAGDVRAMLEAADPVLRTHDLLILPPFQRDGRSFYGPDDVDALRMAHSAGLNAAFLHKTSDREYLHEYSAGWVVEFAIAFAANVASEDVVAIVNYAIARARNAVNQGLHEGPIEKVPLRITVAKFRREADGVVTLKGLKINGSESAATEALRTLLDPDARASQLPPSLSEDSSPDALESSSQGPIRSEEGSG